MAIDPTSAEIDPAETDRRSGILTGPMEFARINPEIGSQTDPTEFARINQIGRSSAVIALDLETIRRSTSGTASTRETGSEIA
jgi:hypothetical protein